MSGPLENVFTLILFKIYHEYGTVTLRRTIWYGTVRYGMVRNVKISVLFEFRIESFILNVCLHIYMFLHTLSTLFCIFAKLILVWSPKKSSSKHSTCIKNATHAERAFGNSALVISCLNYLCFLLAF